MPRCDRTNPNARNYGLGSRDMASAGRNALCEGMESYASIATVSDRFNQFVKFARNELGIRDMRQLEVAHIQQYGEMLREQCESGDLRAATAQNYLSAVNRVLEIARGDRNLHVAPVRDAGIPQRCGVATENHCLDPAILDSAKNQLSNRLAAQVELQRNFGLRFEESCKINATQSLSQAEKTGAITITDGTKGGRTRTIDIVSIEQFTALKQAANIQGSDHCLIPKEQNYREYRNQAYQEAYQAGLPGFHGHRHEYAQNRYEQLTGQACPVVAGVLHNTHHQYLANQLNVSVSDARSIDYAARMQIAQELGHGRIDITNSYLG